MSELAGFEQAFFLQGAGSRERVNPETVNLIRSVGCCCMLLGESAEVGEFPGGNKVSVGT